MARLLARMNREAKAADVPARRVQLVVAIDRLLARLLVSAPTAAWVVKGGFATSAAPVGKGRARGVLTMGRLRTQSRRGWRSAGTNGGALTRCPQRELALGERAADSRQGQAESAGQHRQAPREDEHPRARPPVTR